MFDLQMKNHYEVLNLEKNCSAKDVKESFIKLSKKYHPDKNKSLEAHKKFVEVNEAYSVLGKACSRIRYDESLVHSPRGSRVVHESSSQTSSPFWVHENPYSHYYKGNYDKDIKFKSAIKVKPVLCCCVLMAIGTGLRLFFLWKDMKMKDTKSKEVSLLLQEVKERSSKLGKEQAIIEFERALLKKRGEAQRPSQN